MSFPQAISAFTSVETQSEQQRKVKAISLIALLYQWPTQYRQQLDKAIYRYLGQIVYCAIPDGLEAHHFDLSDVST